jgi:hypothetical protein
MSIVLKNIRFNKFDLFLNPVFICSSENENEYENYKQLKSYAKQLKKKFPDIFLPIYNSEEYNFSSIKICKNTQITQLKLNQNDLVNLTFRIKKKKSDKNLLTYVNCILVKVKLVKRAPLANFGDDIVFDDIFDNSDEEGDEQDPTGGHSVV